MSESTDHLSLIFEDLLRVVSFVVVVNEDLRVLRVSPSIARRLPDWQQKSFADFFQCELCGKPNLDSLRSGLGRIHRVLLGEG